MSPTLRSPTLKSPTMNPRLARRVTAEALGTMFLTAAVVGSGIMAERLAGGNEAVALLANSLATGAALVCLIASFGPVSGGHFNPAVTMCDAFEGGTRWRDAAAYVTAQMFSACAGAALAHAMFGLPLFTLSQHSRSGHPLLLSEFVATFGLLAVIWGCTRLRAAVAPFSVAAYIMAAYWFTSSTSFANPAVTLARAFTDTYTGIRLENAVAFIPVQLAGAAAATVVMHWLAPRLPAENVVVPHSQT